MNFFALGRGGGGGGGGLKLLPNYYVPLPQGQINSCPMTVPKVKRYHELVIEIVPINILQIVFEFYSLLLFNISHLLIIAALHVFL